MVAVTLTSPKEFSLSEVAATAVPCFEQATVDMRKAQRIGSIRWGLGRVA